MLHFIRERAQGWIAWVIVGLISVPFALWGINQYFTGGSEAPVAVVNDVEITLPQFNQAMQNQKERIRSMLGDQVNEDMVDRFVRTEDVLDMLVNNELLLQAADDQNMGISAEIFRSQISAIPDFQEGGRFSMERYQAFLKRRPGFESLVRQDLMRNQIRAGVMNTGILADEELNTYISFKDQQRSFSYAEISAPRYVAEVAITDEDKKKYYDENGSRFTLPEQVSLQYVELKLDDIKKDFKVSDEEIKQAYEREKERFGIPEERRASHILIQVDADADDAARSAARGKAEAVLKDVQAGKDFAALAKEHSQDPGSATAGGDLGFFAKGVMTPPFEDAVFGMNKGDTSDIVETDFGFHIIHLSDIRSSSIKPLQQVRVELTEQILREKAQGAFRNKQEEMSKLAFDDATTLDGVSKKLELEILETGFITQGTVNAGIAARPKIRDTAFGKEVLQDGYNSEVLEVEPGHVVVIRKKEHKPSTLRPYEEVASMIEKILRKEGAEARAEEEAKKILTTVEEGRSLKQAAATLKLPFHEDKRSGRQDPAVDRAIVSEVFRMSLGKDKATVKPVRMSNGNQAIVELRAVHDGNAAVVEEAKKNTWRRELENMRMTVEFSHFLEALKAESDVRLFPDNIK